MGHDLIILSLLQITVDFGRNHIIVLEATIGQVMIKKNNVILKLSIDTNNRGTLFYSQILATFKTST